MKINTIAILLSIVLFSTLVTAKVKVAEGVFLDAYFRPRLELDGLDFNSHTGFDAYSTFRTRLGITLDNLVENTTLYINIADSRTMGFNDPYLTGTPVAPNKQDENLGLDVGYIEVRELFSPGTMLRIGRMENNIGRERLFGPGNWSVFGPRSYDGIKFGYINKGLDIDIKLWSLYGRNGDRHWYYNTLYRGEAPVDTINNNYKMDHTLTGIDATVLQGKLNVMLFLDLDQNPVNNTTGGSEVANSRWTFAGYFNHKAKDNIGLNFEMDAAYQFGKKAYSAGNADISAYLLAFDALWNFEHNLKPFAGIGLDLVSGDDSSNPDKINNFYEYYYSAHSFQGHMDLFTGTEEIKDYGLRDIIFRAGFNPLKSLKCKVDIHHFATQFDFPSEVDSSEAKELGWETDITLDYDLHKGLKARLGYDFFLPTEDWQGAGADRATFVYLELTGTL
jgi:hypothetical protein